MDNLEVNKAVAAVLVGGIVFMMSGVVASLVVKPTQLHHSVLKIETGAPAAAGAAKDEPLTPIHPLLASADVAAGEALAKKLCAACHTFNDGGKNGVGPNLYGVINRAHGAVAGYNASNAIKAKEGPWTYEEMNAWLKKPSAYAPGTKMAFAGINSDKQRADIILYLRSLAATPAPLPTP
jgi:cytochrome c